MSPADPTSRQPAIRFRGRPNQRRPGARPGRGALLVCLSCLALVAMAGCKQERSSPPEERGGSGAPAPAAPQPGEPTEGVVEVLLLDGAITVPGAIAPGTIRFHVRNGGSETHSFAIRGGGVEAALDEPLEAGGVGSLTTDLAQGDYVVSCPRHHSTTARRLLVTERATTG